MLPQDPDSLSCGPMARCDSLSHDSPSGAHLMDEGRRLYLHEGSFEDLAFQGADVAWLVYSSLVALPAIKLMHHDVVEEAVVLHGFSVEKAIALESVISAKWFDSITETLRQVALRQTPGITLIGSTERIVATCFDSNYYTFATTEHAAKRMYADSLKLKEVWALTRGGNDAYRDLTILKGRCLVFEGNTMQSLSPAELEGIKLSVMARFQHDLNRIVELVLWNLTDRETRCLQEFVTKCLAAVRRTVMHFRG